MGKDERKAFRRATPLLATLFAWELAGTLQEDMPSSSDNLETYGSDRICKGVSKRAKKFKGKSAEAADVARRFFRVANRRLNEVTRTTE